jgi:hypothetical protein
MVSPIRSTVLGECSRDTSADAIISPRTGNEGYSAEQRQGIWHYERTPAVVAPYGLIGYPINGIRRRCLP